MSAREPELVHWQGDLDGWALVVEGHGVDRAALDSIAAAEGFTPPLYTEVWLDRRRLKWCERVDGCGCDNDGEWHVHYFAVKPGPSDAAYTLIQQDGVALGDAS